MSVDNSKQGAWNRMQSANARKRQSDADGEGSDLNGGDGDGTSGGVTEDWKSGVNAQLEQLHGDVRKLLYGLIGGFLLLGAAGFGLYQSISTKVTDLQVAQAKAEGDSATRDAQMNGKLDLLLERNSSKTR